MAALALLAALAVFAGPVAAYLEGASVQLFDRAGYIAAVLPQGEGS
jgi:multicomponent K+:H+ antiporter subunit D